MVLYLYSTKVSSSHRSSESCICLTSLFRGLGRGVPASSWKSGALGQKSAGWKAAGGFTGQAPSDTAPVPALLHVQS